MATIDSRNLNKIHRTFAGVGDMAVNGSCLCGVVKFEVTGAFKLVGNCHCSNCRKANGAAFVTWGIIDSEQFRWTGGDEQVQEYASSPGVARCFCKLCGSTLVTAHAGKVTEIVVGALDDDPGMKPGEHIFVSSKAPWHDITDGLPQHQYWPPGMTN